MSIRKLGFEKADRYGEALENLHVDGQGWATSPEIALRAATLDEGYMRWRRLANKGLRFVGIERSDEPESAPRLLYGVAETHASLTMLERAGLIESQRDEAVGLSLEIAEPETIYRVAPGESRGRPDLVRIARDLGAI